MRSSKRGRSVRLTAGLVALIGCAAGAVRAQTVGQTAPRADALVSAAVKTAAAQNKVVLVEFGASWCTWCRKFEAFVKAPETGPIVASNYVVVNLTVQENDDKKGLENPGGEDAMSKWGGAGSGLPFYVFLSSAGVKVADSKVMPDGTNVGFPGNPQEVQLFMKLIERTAPRLTPADRTKVLDYLNKTLTP